MEDLVTQLQSLARQVHEVGADETTRANLARLLKTPEEIANEEAKRKLASQKACANTMRRRQESEEVRKAHARATSARNKVRYHTDPVFREKMKAAQRERYQRAKVAAHISE
ncbi:hypothetical protein WJX72_009852 [[Myrmecia] bisecta]|uniref:Uncharacterized protein n=1 Tax=[Myrmecia] bisecta TaxID=41462 RepID=A0AAW1R7Y6_9CHLO